MFKLLIVAAATVVVGLPVVSVPTYAEAQVLAGRNASRNAQRPRETREARLATRLGDAEDRLFELEERITALETQREDAGSLTPAQERQLVQLTERREREQREIERLNEELSS